MANDIIDEVLRDEPIFIDSDTYDIELDEDDIYYEDYDGLEYYNYVGMDDPFDYGKLYLSSAANLSFTINATDTAKFTIWKLVPGKNNSYTQKALQSTTLKYSPYVEVFTATTKPLLLEEGTYYISVESVNAKKGGEAFYNVEVDQMRSVFFEDSYDENDWNDMKTRGPQSEQYDDLETVSDPEDLYVDGWVGFGDPIDYYRFSLNGAANISFYVGAWDAAKFTIYTLSGSKGNYSLKALQSTSLSKRDIPMYYDEDEDEYYYDDEISPYWATTKALLLEGGSYYISVESTNAKKGGNASYDFYINESASAFFEDVYDGNNWNDMKTRGPQSEQYDDLETISDPEDLYVDGWVGFGDPIDYYRFSLSGAANISFNVGAYDAAKFTIYTLTGTKGNYSLKALQSTSLSKVNRPMYYDEDEDEYYYDDEDYYPYGATTKLLLLEGGSYYISVESTNAKKGGSADYCFSVSWDSAFFNDVYDENNWNDMKTRGPQSEQYDNVGVLSSTDDLYIDEAWVGFGDPIDYYRFSLNGAANLSFYVGAWDAAKFTLYTLTGSKGNYSLKALQSTSLSKVNRPMYYDEDEDEYYYDDEDYYYRYAATTKSLLLEGGTYYFSVESTNAKQGGSASYSVYLNETGCAFFEDVYDGNNWNDMKTRGAQSEQYDDLETISDPEDLYVDGWVGFGDSIDYYRFTLNGAANIGFYVEAMDAAKFTIYTLAGTKGNYSLKSLQSTTLSKRNRPLYYDEDEDEYYYDYEDDFYPYGATTKLLLLEGGSYYISVESTNAKKGGSAGYCFSVSWDSAFFEDVYDENNWNDMKTRGPQSEQYEHISIYDDGYFEGWVGFGDPVDYYSFTLYDPAKLSFNIGAADAAKVTIYTLAGTKGNYSLKSLQSTSLSKVNRPMYYDEDEDEYYYDDEDYYYRYAATTKSLLLEKGTYYISVESTNAKQGGSAGYEAWINERDSFFFEEIYDENNWLNLAKYGPTGDVDDLEYLGYETEYEGWVGFGDPVDYAVFRLSKGTYSQNAAVLSFNIEATDNVKVTIYSVVEKLSSTGRVYSLKSLQSTTTKYVKPVVYDDDYDDEPYNYVATTKSLTIKDGGYYAISVQSTNAAKGGSASYYIEVNEDYADFFDYDYDYAALPDEGQDVLASTELHSAQNEPLSAVAMNLESTPDFFGKSAAGMLAAL